MEYNFEFNITSFCQAKCASCARTINIDKFTPSHYPLDAFAKTLENLKGVDVGIITLCGEYGDPMMHPDIEEFIKLATKNYSVELMTNGGIRNPTFYEHLAKTYSPRLNIFFGIDGIDEPTNSLYRKGVDFDKAWDNMNTWFANGGKGIWEFLVFTWNQNQIETAHQIAKSKNIPIGFKMNRRMGFPGLIASHESEKIIDKIKTLH